MIGSDVLTAKECIRDLGDAVYTIVFYNAMDSIIEENKWRSYVHDITGKTYTFETIDDFLTSHDGLAIENIGVFQACIKAVASSGGRIAGMAKSLLKKLAGLEPPMTLVAVNAESALTLPGREGFAKEGDNQYSLGCDNITARSQGDGGTSAAYLAARLKKAGREDLLEELKTGAIKSVRSAAIKAGIIKAVPTVRMTEPAKAAEAILQRAGLAFTQQLHGELTRMLQDHS